MNILSKILGFSAIGLMLLGCGSDSDATSSSSTSASSTSSSSAGGGGVGGAGMGGAGGAGGAAGGAGGQTAEGGGMPFADQMQYSRLNPFYSQPEDCQFNCYQTLVFCTSGTVHITLSDIIFPGTYETIGDTIYTSFPPGDMPEIEGDYSFVMSENDTLVAADLNPRPWDRQKNLDPFICNQ